VPETALLRAASEAGVPVPGIVAEDDEYLVVERIEGETIPRKILRDDEYASARPKLAAHCAEALAGIHSIPVDSVPGLNTETDPLATWRAMLDGFGQPHPTFELALRWLDERRPPPTGATVVHGDFRNGNLIVGPDGLRAVLDWELAHVGDPMEDLGWLCVKAWRFGVDRPVGGFGEYADLFAAYEDASGRAVDPDVVRWWEVLGTLKWGIMCIAQAFTHLSGTVRSVELATIGRRVCENEWDLLELIG
jgi:aminoglycoside phosphotransferase (APT) family kinase protein